MTSLCLPKTRESSYLHDGQSAAYPFAHKSGGKLGFKLGGAGRRKHKRGAGGGGNWVTDPTTGRQRWVQSGSQNEGPYDFMRANKEFDQEEWRQMELGQSARQTDAQRQRINSGLTDAQRLQIKSTFRQDPVQGLYSGLVSGCCDASSTQMARNSIGTSTAPSSAHAGDENVKVKTTGMGRRKSKSKGRRGMVQLG